jgi:hypothetical protein
MLHLFCWLVLVLFPDGFFLCSSWHSQSCLRSELAALIRGCIFPLLISNQSIGGRVVFVAVSSPALFTFLKKSVYFAGVLLLLFALS